MEGLKMKKSFLILFFTGFMFLNTPFISACDWTWEIPVTYKAHQFYDGDLNELVSVIVNKTNDRIVGYLYAPDVMINLAERSATIYGHIEYSNNYECCDGFVFCVCELDGTILHTTYRFNSARPFSLPELPHCGHALVKSFVFDEEFNYFYSTGTKIHYRDEESEDD